MAAEGGLARPGGLPPVLLRVHSALAHSPFVLSEEHATELGQPAGRFVEGAKDLLAFPERECDSDAIRVESTPQRGRCRLTDEVGECVDEFGRKGDASDDEQLRLDRAALHAPLVLGEEHLSQLREPMRRMIEHSQHRIAIVDRESDEILLGVERDKKHIARVLEAGREQEPSEIGDVLLANGNTGEPHASVATRRAGPSNGCARLLREAALAAKQFPMRARPTLGCAAPLRLACALATRPGSGQNANPSNG
jgi:hypothetical protein